MTNYIKILFATLFLVTACSHMQQSLEDGMVLPILKEEPKLIYPITAQQNNRLGTSVILIAITEEGKVNQTLVKKSSGWKDLDKAAENYCKDLIFIPAKYNGEPIECSMKLEVKFNLNGADKDIQNKIAEVLELYTDAEQLKGAARLAIQKKILKKHNNIVYTMRDGLKFNEYLYSVVNNNIKDEWKPFTEPYPVSFLLYHDFITRFSDYDSLSIVQSLLEHALKLDLDYINLLSNSESNDYKNSAILIQKIKRFVESNYPQIGMDELNLEKNNRNNNLS
jgi:TonB family protein